MSYYNAEVWLLSYMISAQDVQATQSIPPLLMDLSMQQTCLSYRHHAEVRDEEAMPISPVVR